MALALVTSENVVMVFVICKIEMMACLLIFGNISFIQGLTWYAKGLRIDEDGDVAEQFLEEVIPEVQTSTTNHPKPFPRFQINNRNRPAKVENQVILKEGKLQQCIEHQGRLLLV